jgi:hypothetical protein
VTLLQTSVRTRHDPDCTSRPGQRDHRRQLDPHVLSWAAATLVTAGYTGVVRRT